MDLKELLFFRTKTEVEAYRDMENNPHGSYNDSEIAQQRERFCSVYQVVVEAGLEDEYTIWKEAWSTYSVDSTYKYKDAYDNDCIHITIDIGNDNHFGIAYVVKDDEMKVVYGKNGKCVLNSNYESVDVPINTVAAFELARKTCKIRHPEMFDTEQKRPAATRRR